MEQFKEDPQKKHKKKKHHRSRSRSQNKKHKRSRSRSQKKDKKKKDKSSHNDHDRHRHHRSSSGSKDKAKLQATDPAFKPKVHEDAVLSKKHESVQKYDDQGHRGKDHKKQRERDERKQRDKDERKSRERTEKKSRDRNERRSKQRYERRSKERQERRQKDRDRKEKDHKDRDEKDRDRKDRDRDYKDRDEKDRDRKDKDKEKERKEKSHKEKQHKERELEGFGSNAKEDKKSVQKYDREKDKKQETERREKNKSRERSHDRGEKRKEISKYDKYERYDREQRYESSRRRDRERQTFRSRSQQRRNRSPERQDRNRAPRRRSRSREHQSRNDRWRSDRRRETNSRFDSGRFRFDSPPKSDESDMSDDPEKMEKLNRMKAEKELVTSKADRKLYLGNLPPNITSQQLMDMLNAALKKMEINTDVQGDSIISAWISPDGVGHYAFVEFRTAQQATNGLALNGASLFGYQLKLGRPKQYIEYNKQLLSKFGSDSSIDTIIKKVQAMGGQVAVEVSEKIVCPPTRILVMKHIVTVEELAIDEEYQEIYEDVLDMAKRFGDVIKVVIPRPHEVFDLEAVRTRVKGLGYIFVEYRTVEQAIFARKQFVQKQFSGRSVACSFLNEKRFHEGEYDIVERVIIDF